MYACKAAVGGPLAPWTAWFQQSYPDHAFVARFPELLGRKNTTCSSFQIFCTLCGLCAMCQALLVDGHSPGHWFLPLLHCELLYDSITVSAL